MSPNKLEDHFSHLRKAIVRGKLTAASLGASDDCHTIPLATFAQRAADLGLAGINYFIESANGLVLKADVEQLLAADRLQTAVAHLQARRRKDLIPDGLKLPSPGESSEDNKVAGDARKAYKTAMDDFFEGLDRSASRTFDQFRICDVDKDGFISRAEFMAGVSKKSGFPEDKCRSLFREFDRAGEGKIGFRDFASRTAHSSGREVPSLPSADYSRRLFDMCAAAKLNQDRRRRENEAKEAPHIFRPAMTTRRSSNPAYLTKDTFESTMHGRGRSEVTSHTENSLNDKVRYQAEARAAQASRLAAAVRCRIERDDRDRSKRLAADLKERSSPEATARLQRSKGQSKALYQMRVMLSDVGA
jgi:hypothetical protein